MLERIETTTTIERDPDTRQPIFRQRSLEFMPDRFDRRGGPISTDFVPWAFAASIIIGLVLVLAIVIDKMSHSY
jgi:hypothetical protein